jgi:hypothetical protein
MGDICQSSALTRPPKRPVTFIPKVCPRNCFLHVRVR